MSATLPTLRRRGSELASPVRQLEILQKENGLPRFEEKLGESSLLPLRATSIEVLQINVGKLCNQTCKHCHVDAGPDRTEIMTQETAAACIRALERADSVKIVDITGGAPELHPVFRYLVTEARRLGLHVIDRCNLTVLELRSQRGLVEFLADNRVEIIASLPYHSARPTDAQRGAGVFDTSIRALRRLNEAGYARNPGQRLCLVCNPVGAFLPPKQAAVEADFRRELRERHGIEIDAVYTITNMPISRFLDFLLESGNYESYMCRLIEAYNPVAAEGAMCRTMVSVGWDGVLYDCDFNQMLSLPVEAKAGRHIADVDLARHEGRRIATGRHCFGCTAGAGSSCGGATA